MITAAISEISVEDVSFFTREARNSYDNRDEQ